MRSLRAPGGVGWEQHKRAGGHCFPIDAPGEVLSLDPTLSWKAVAPLSGKPWLTTSTLNPEEEVLP